MKNSSEIAKQICEELGIKWNENATCATLNGKRVTSEDIFRAFGVEPEEER